VSYVADASPLGGQPGQLLLGALTHCGQGAQVVTKHSVKRLKFQRRSGDVGNNLSRNGWAKVQTVGPPRRLCGDRPYCSPSPISSVTPWSRPAV
jgi:hypothetical protein